MIFFPIIDGLQFSIDFLLYSQVTQLHIHVYILFSYIIMLCHKWLDIVPSAIQQDVQVLEESFERIPCVISLLKTHLWEFLSWLSG